MSWNNYSIKQYTYTKMGRGFVDDTQQRGRGMGVSRGRGGDENEGA